LALFSKKSVENSKVLPGATVIKNYSFQFSRMVLIG